MRFRKLLHFPAMRLLKPGTKNIRHYRVSYQVIDLINISPSPEALVDFIWEEILIKKLLRLLLAIDVCANSYRQVTNYKR